MIKNDIHKLPLENANYCVVDVETTGLSPSNNGIIEIGIVKVSNLKIVDTFHSLINPAKEIPYFITQLTGITNEDVYEAPFFEDIANDIEVFIGNDILTAHNFSFDSSFLRKEFSYCGHDKLANLNLCTLKISRRLYPTLKSKSLRAVTRHLRLKNTNAHRALADAEITAKLLIKMIKEVKKKHKIKSVGELISFQSIPNIRESTLKIKKKLSSDVSSLPDAPGIYTFLNSKDEIIYIGKAKSLRDRVKSYFSSTAPRKAKKIIKQASRLKIEITNSELTALLTEAELIKVIKPRLNTMLKKYGNKYFLRITAADKFPTIELTNSFDFDGNDYFGLFISKKKADVVLEMIEKTFTLRECTNAELAKGSSCFLADIERCNAPCVNSDEEQYNNELNNAYEFLYGKNQFALNRLINKMKAFSSKEKFEKAAAVKTLIDMILTQTHKSSLLAEPVNRANVLFEISGGFGKDYILMLSGKIYIKSYLMNMKNHFENALDEYYDGTININNKPNDEDLEKMKITLNWLVKNRNKVRIFYLKDYKNKQKLYAKLSRNSQPGTPPLESTFDIKHFLNSENELAPV